VDKIAEQGIMIERKKIYFELIKHAGQACAQIQLSHEISQVSELAGK
jgi:ribosomal protein L9